MPTDKTTEDANASALRAKLQKDASKFLKGVTNNDVDWFLRGGNIENAHSSSPMKVDPKSSATVISDGSHVILQNPTTAQSDSIPHAVDSNSIPKLDIPSNSLHRSRTLDDTDPVSTMSHLSLRRTLTNISQKSEPDNRTLPSSTSSTGHSSRKNSETKKMGFFKKLFSNSSNSESEHHEHHQRNSISSGSSSPMTSKWVPASEPPKPVITSSHSQNTSSSAIDPKLEEYLRYYRQRKSISGSATMEEPRSSPSTPSVVSSTAEPPRLDLAGNPIPSHPPVSPLPPAIINSKSPYSQSDSARALQSSKFSILKRHHSSFAQKSPLTKSQSLEEEDDYVTHISSSNIANKEARIPPIPVLQKMEPLRKVAFAADVFVHDPPQQIPSRHPRKGNVEVAHDGTIKIHHLNEEEKKKYQQEGAGGVVVGGSGHLKVLTPEERREAEQQMANELKEDSKFNHKSEVQIDKPMVSRHKQFDENGHYIMDLPTVKLQLDELYTRCCHLREILPIPAIAKQIPKGTTSPLLVLQLKNPKPSLIEILAFSDFIRIAPIICISLDGVMLSEQMFRIILSSLVYKKHLEKLSLRNTPIDADGWKLLCWFLSVNKRLRRLDLTQCPTLTVNSQRLKESRKSTGIERMESNLNNRTDMDWPLMTATLIARGGIEDIILSGCKILNFEIFKNFIEMAASLMTVNLGLAYNDLTLKEIEVVAKFLENNDTILGLDMGYNDLSTGLMHFINYSNKHFENSKLMFLSLNSTNLKFDENTKKLIPALSKLKNLKFLDISNNKMLFPRINDYLFSYFPLFPNLVRVHLDNNDLDSKTLITMAEAMTLCSRLNYISLLGNHLDKVASIALVNALKTSKTIFTLDVEYDQMDPELREKIGLYTMRNMEQVLYSTEKKRDSTVQQTDSISQRILVLLQRGSLADKNDHEVENFLKEAKKAKTQINDTISQLFKLQTKRLLDLQGKESLIRLCFLDSALEKGLALISDRYKIESEDISKYTTGGLVPQTMSNSSIMDDDDLTQVDDVEIKNDNVSLSVPVSHSPSSRSLKDMDRSEGSVLKLTSLISQHDMNNIPKDFMLNDDEIKKVLLNPVDIHLVTEVLSQMKKQGITMEEVFKKDSDTSRTIPKDEQLNIDNLRSKLSSLKLDQDDDDDDDDNDSGASSISTLSPSLTDQNTMLNKGLSTVHTADTIDDDIGLKDGDLAEVRKDGDTEAINETYDSLLSDLVREKTNNLQ